MCYQYLDKEIKQRLIIAIDILFKHDRFLLEHEIHERTIAHKLATYLQNILPDCDVDCEYNLKGLDTKELPGIQDCDEQRSTDRVLPDIIVHKRNSDKNLLVIEIKVQGKESQCDIAKLKLFTSEQGRF